LLLWLSWLSSIVPSALAAPNSYYHTDIEGWQVRVSTALLNRDPTAARESLDLLRLQLSAIARDLPDAPLAQLRRVPIQIGLSGVEGLLYHMASASGTAIRGSDFVEIASARFFIRSSREKPTVVLHELAHAFHERVLGDDNPFIHRAYLNALTHHLYERVPRYDGRLVRAYALTSEREYFAELTEAYFGRNDTYPFTREELRIYDPAGLAMVRTVWGAP
jgi:hypothetical protein